MSLEQVAELGYFVIKYIEDFGLTGIVGRSGEGWGILNEGGASSSDAGPP